MIKNIIIPVILLIVNLTVSGQPASDAVFEKIEKTYTLNEDGSMDFRYYKKLKLLTHNSFNRLYGETFIIYNPLHQQIKINLSQVTQKDGKIIKAPENAFNEVLPLFAADAPYFNHLREMVVTHAGLEIDAVIELDYTLHSEAGYFPALMADEILSETSPVLEENIIIRAPKWKKLKFQVVNLRTAPKITASEEFTEYRFTFVNLSENAHESNEPLGNGHLPHLLFSTFSVAAGQHFLIDQEALKYKVDQSMKDAVAKIREEAKNDLQLVLKIRDMVVNNINIYPVPLEYSGYTARHPIETWNSNGGTPYEKCLLMTALYREAKINAEPMLIVPSAIYNDTIGILSQVSEFLVQVNPRELEQMILSPVAINEQNQIYSLGGITSILLNKDKPYINDYKETYENKITFTGNFNLDDSMTLSGNAVLHLSEKVNPYYKIKTDTNAMKQLFGGGFTAQDIKAVKNQKATQIRSEMNYVIMKKQAAKNYSGYNFVNLPLCTKGSDSWHIGYLNSGRAIPFRIPFPINEQYDFTVTIPEGMKSVDSLKVAELKAPFGELSINMALDGNKVSVKRKLMINQSIIPAENYKEFKQMIDLWNDPKYKQLVLKK
jgi:hypothetical protein